MTSTDSAAAPLSSAEKEIEKCRRRGWGQCGQSRRSAAITSHRDATMPAAGACPCSARLSKWRWGSGQARRDHRAISTSGPARLSTCPRPRHCPQPSGAEHGEEMAEQRVAADGHSVAPSALPPCPQQNAIVRLISLRPPQHPRSSSPRTRTSGARRGARAACASRSGTISEWGDVLACHHEDVACRSLLCPMHGVQLRPDRPSAATRPLGW